MTTERLTQNWIIVAFVSILLWLINLEDIRKPNKRDCALCTGSNADSRIQKPLQYLFHIETHRVLYLCFVGSFYNWRKCALRQMTKWREVFVGVELHKQIDRIDYTLDSKRWKILILIAHNKRIILLTHNNIKKLFVN